MDRDFIINNYINFCNDLQINANDNKSKTKYINEYIKTSILYNGIEKTEIDKTKNTIKRFLKKVKFLTSTRKY